MENIFKLVKKNDIKGIESLIKSGYYFLDLQDEHRWTALMYACRYNIIEIAFKLIEAGCNLDIQDTGGWTALIYACRHNRKEIAFKLIEVCNLDIQYTSGWTALMYACWYNRKNIVFKLIEAGCDLGLREKYNNTYKCFVQKDLEATVEKALKARKLYNKLFNKCIKYVRRNRNLFKEKDLMGLNKDIRCYFIKN